MSHGCTHPVAEMGDLLRKAVRANEGKGRLRQVCICLEYPGQMMRQDWETLCDTCLIGRQQVPYRETVPEELLAYGRSIYPRAPGPKPVKIDTDALFTKRKPRS